MKYLDTYRDPDAARGFVEEIRRSMTRPWAVLEVCGGQAQNLMRFGTDRALPEGLELIHGPGCPVSAAPAGLVDRAVAVAARPGVAVCTRPGRGPGPGVRGDTLQAALARGCDVRPVYSPLDALGLPKKHPDRRVVVLAVGFETTAPAAATAILEAERLGLDNLSILCAFFRLARRSRRSSPRPAAGPAPCSRRGPSAAVTGLREYEPIAERFRVPVVVTGPEPADLLDALARAVRQLERGTFAVENQYAAGGPARRQPPGAGGDRRGVRAGRRPLARPGPAARLRPGPPRAVPPVRRRRRVPRGRGTGRRHPPCRTRLPRRRGPRRPVSSRLAAPPSAPVARPTTRSAPAMVSAEGTCAAYYRHRRSPDGPSPTPPLTIIPAPAPSLRGS